MEASTKFLESLSPPDSHRLIEDIAATVPLYNEIGRHGKPIDPTAAMLAVAGGWYLADGARIENSKILDHSGFGATMDAWNFPVDRTKVKLSYFLAGVVLARKDVCQRFTHDGELDWVACLQWLVLHGIFELQLWPFLSSDFVVSLRTDSVRLHGQKITPLELCVIRERPELLRPFGGSPNEEFRAWFPEWLIGPGLQDYHLFWALTRGDFRQRAGAPPGAVPVAMARPTSRFAIRRDGGLASPVIDQARLEGRFVQLRTNYPCSFFDFSDKNEVEPIGSSIAARHAPQGGVDIVGPVLTLQFPAGQHSANAFLILQLAFPPTMDPNLIVTISVEGASEWEWPAITLVRETIIVPVPPAFRRRDPSLRIVFRGTGIPMQGISGPVSYYGSLRNIRIWTVGG
jgi:hypothetical protein